jgi:hypothetical protein
MARKHWHTTQVNAMLQNSVYAGTQYFSPQTKFKAEATPPHLASAATFSVPVPNGSPPAIVSQELFDRVQSRLQRNAKRERNRIRTISFPVSFVVSMFDMRG